MDKDYKLAEHLIAHLQQDDVLAPMVLKSPVTSGEIWLKIQLDKDAKYLGSSLSAAGGVSDPVRLAEEDRETPYEYYFHLATIDGSKVVQHQAGTVYLQTHPGTFGPSGMS